MLAELEPEAEPDAPAPGEDPGPAGEREHDRGADAPNICEREQEGLNEGDTHDGASGATDAATREVGAGDDEGGAPPTTAGAAPPTARADSATVGALWEHWVTAARAPSLKANGLMDIEPLPWRTAPMGEPSARGETPHDGRAAGPHRGARASVFIAYHGWDAVGAHLLTHQLPAFWAGGLDNWDAARDLIRTRQGHAPILTCAREAAAEPTIIPEVDLICTGSPCQGASWAGWCAGDGPKPDVRDPRNRLYVQQPGFIMPRAKAAIIEFLASVLRGEFDTELHRPMIARFHAGAWTTVTWNLDAAKHGGDQPRRRAYTLAFAPEVVDAAARAGLPVPEPPAESSHVARLENALVPDDVVDACLDHARLYVDADVPEPSDAQRARLAEQVEPIGRWCGQAVWDALSPGLPLKVRGEMPLVRLRDGRVRRMLFCEFTALGGLPWAVGFGGPGDAKTFAGNTWDANLTRITMDATLEYMAPWLRQRAHERASLHRVATFVAAVSARHSLPARRAFRTWAAVAHTESELREAIAAGADMTVVVQVDGTGHELAVRRHPMDAAAAAGTTLVAERDARSYDPVMLPLPETRRPPKTSPREPPVGPTPEQVRAFEAKYPHWTACYSKGGLHRHLRWAADADDDARHALDARGEPNLARRMKQRPGDERSELRQGADDFDPGIDGLHVTVRPDGTPTLTVPVREAQQPHVTVRFRELDEWRVRANWDDQELGYVSVWGAEDECDGRPWLTSCSPNAAKAYELFEATSAAFDVEIQRGWIERRTAVMTTKRGGRSGARTYEAVPVTREQAETDARNGPEIPIADRMRAAVHDPTPPFIPMDVPPTNARAKKNGTARLFANTSWPMPGTAFDEWHGLPVAPNGMKRTSRLAALEWASVESMAHGAGIIHAIGVAARLQPHGACDDLWKWFRQVPASTASQRQQVFAWNGKFMVDKMVQMGRFASAHVAQRVSFLVADIYFTEVVTLAWRWLGSVRGDDRYAALHRIVSRRVEEYGLRGSGLLHLEVCQDDFGWVAPCPEIAWIAWHTLPHVLRALGVRYSEEKREAQGAPGVMFVFMGALVDLTVGRLCVAADKQAKWLDDVMPAWKGIKPGGLVPEKQLGGTMGLGVFLCKSLRKARMLLDRGFNCLAARSGSMKPVAYGLMVDLAALTATVRTNAGVPLIVDPRWWSAGELGIACDASVADDSGGYGGNVQHFAFAGEWSAAARKYCDISTLELFTIAFLVVIAGARAGLAGRRIVVRSDNEAAVKAYNKRGSTAPTMGAAVRAVDAACEAHAIDVLLVHIPGERNVIADKLSRGDVDEALGLLRQLTGAEPQLCRLPDEWTTGPPMKSMLRAAKRWRPAGVRHGSAV